MVPPRSLWPAVARARTADDLGCPALEQLAPAAALGRHAPGLRVAGTAAGLRAVVELGDDVDEEELIRRAG